MIDFSERELFELDGVICEMGPLFEVVYSVVYHSRNGAYLEANRVIDQFSQEVRDNLEQYLPLIESLRKEINEFQESQQRILKVTTQ